MIPVYNKQNPVQSYLAIRRDPVTFLADVIRESGDFARVNVLIFRFHLVNDPALIREALSDHSEQLIIKGGVSHGLARLIGNGILTNRGDQWRASRAQLQPLFHQGAMRAALPIITARVQETLERWRTSFSGQPLSIHRELLALSFRIACSTLFNHLPTWDAALQFADAIWVLQGDGMQRHLDGMDYVSWLPLPRNRKVNAARAVLYRLAQDAVEQGAGQTVDEILSILFAGTESPVNTLCFALKLLEEHPAWCSKILADLAQHSPGAPHDDVDRFDVLAQVLSECIRLYPAGWAFERYAEQDVQLGGERVPKGSRLLFSPFLMHRNTRFWRDPERFDPLRFTAGPNAAEGVPKFGYMPFGAGPRSCIGARLAQAEMRITLRMLLEQCTWKTAYQPGEPPLNAEGSFKIRLSHPLMLNLEVLPNGTRHNTQPVN